MGPILEDLKKDVGDKAHVIKIDVDKNQAVANQYQIRSVPTLLLFKQGKIIWKQSGVVQKNQLKQIIEQNAA